MEFNIAMTVLHKISPPPFSVVPSQILAIHHSMGGKEPMTLKQQIQVLFHSSTDNKKIKEKSCMKHTIENGFVWGGKSFSCIKHLEMFSNLRVL